MKKLNYFILIALIGGIFTLTSCNKDDDDEPQDLSPSLSFTGGPDFISEDAMVETNEQFKIGVTALSNSNSGKSLNTFTVTQVENNTPQQLWDSTFSSDVFQAEWTFTAPSQPTVFKLLFKVTDKAGEQEEKSIQITVEQAGGNIYEYSQTTLGSYDANIGSSFASLNGEVYLLSEAKANSSDVDIMYFWDADVNDQATIVAPANDVAAQVFGNANVGVATWSTRNDTKLKIVQETVIWSEIIDDAKIVELTQNGMTENLVNDLAVGDVVAFITDTDKPDFAGKRGLIRITDINAGADGSITFDVKVQQ